ncbi:WD40 repeat domain-containing protein [Actinomadura chibensis]|uniref:WD40 repeat domain-containing protein n=1 Tax=Actinomadura chibensis TaxID=392828 RepID=A0A5D0NLN4_9ACTN|nr:WD40 repeat domain-containing protein [Actinomadura chibensis]TYB45420.1 WD40 repeat domain-containing protein [Actinomadura chibensis]
MTDDELDGLAARLAGAGRWGRRRAARRLAADRSPGAVRALALALASGPDRRTAAVAERALTGLADRTCVDAVCDVMIADGDDRLATLVRAAGYRHSDPASQALLLFMTGDYRGYAELDFDGSMLAAAHAAADDGLRARLADRARASARVEWVDAVVEARGAERLAAVSAREWEAAVETLTAKRRWPGLWRLAQEAPAPWAAWMLRILAEQRWRPPDAAERPGYRRLTALAGQCFGEPEKGFADAPTVLDGYPGRVERLAVTPDGGMLVSAGKGDGVRLWDLPSGDHIEALVHGNWFDLAILPGGTRLAAGCMDRVTVWRLPSGDPVTTLPVPGHTAKSSTLLATPDGGLLLAAGAWLRAYGPAWSERWAARRGSANDHDAVALVNGRAVSAEWSGAIRVYDLDTGESAVAPLHGHPAPVRCVAATPDGTLLASGDDRGDIRLWRLSDGEQTGTAFGHSGRVTALAVAPDGGLLASAGKDGTVRLWRLPDGAAAGELTGHEGRVTHLAVTPDGRILASGGQDGTVRLWRLPDGAPLAVRAEPGARVTCLAVSPDGGLLAGGDARGGLRLWKLWHPDLADACRVPAARLAPSAATRLVEACRDRSPDERAWARLVAALAEWRHRHDVELADESAAAGPADIEIDRERG